MFKFPFLQALLYFLGPWLGKEQQEETDNKEVMKRGGGCIHGNMRKE